MKKRLLWETEFSFLEVRGWSSTSVPNPVSFWLVPVSQGVPQHPDSAPSARTGESGSLTHYLGTYIERKVIDKPPPAKVSEMAL